MQCEAHKSQLVAALKISHWFKGEVAILQDWLAMTLHDEVRRVAVSVRRRKHSPLGWSSGPSCVAAEILRGATK